MSERATVTIDEALAMLPAGNVVHTFRSAQVPGHGTVLVGAELRRDMVERMLRVAPLIELSGPYARELNHGLCIHDDVGPLFIETWPERADS